MHASLIFFAQAVPTLNATAAQRYAEQRLGLRRRKTFEAFRGRLPVCGVPAQSWSQRPCDPNFPDSPAAQPPSMSLDDLLDQTIDDTFNADDAANQDPFVDEDSDMRDFLGDEENCEDGEEGEDAEGEDEEALEDFVTAAKALRRDRPDAAVRAAHVTLSRSLLGEYSKRRRWQGVLEAAGWLAP